MENTIKVYEVDGTDAAMIDGPTVKVHSHWNQNDMVTLEVAGKRYTVLAKDLESAVSNATNTGRFG